MNVKFYKINTSVLNVSAGFTLIELLVVISIIGMLASMVLAGLSSARYKARTQSVKAGFINMRTALELYSQSNQSGSGYYFWGNVQTTQGACPMTSGYMFSSPDIKQGLEGLLKTFPGSTLECMAASDANPVTGPANTWTIMLTVPAQNGVGTTRWCMDNYDVLGRHNILGGFFGQGVATPTIVSGLTYVVRCQ